VVVRLLLQTLFFSVSPHLRNKLVPSVENNHAQLPGGSLRQQAIIANGKPQDTLHKCLQVL